MSLADVQAKINRELWASFVQDDLPIEQTILDELRGLNSVDDATADAVRARTVLGGISDRNLSRSGMQLTTTQRAYRNKSRKLGDVLAQVQAQDNARGADDALRRQALGDMINRGVGLRNAAQQGIGAAAGMEQSREDIYRQQKAQAHANKVNAGMTLGAVGAMLFAGL